LTSQLYVELDMHPDSPVNLSGDDTPYPELPTLPTSNFGAITQSAEDLLVKLNSIDIEKVTSVLIDTIETANKTMHSADKAIDNANTLMATPGIPEAIEDIRVALKNFKNITQIMNDSNLVASAAETLKNVDRTISSAEKAINSTDETMGNVNALVTIPGIPEAIEDIRLSLKSFKSIMLKVDNSNLQEAINAGHLALANLTKTLEKTSKMMEPNSPIQYNLIELTKEFEETARAIRSLIETLERNPQELIFGKDKKAKGE
jgi:paraquat-inducible protein B